MRTTGIDVFAVAVALCGCTAPVTEEIVAVKAAAATDAVGDDADKAQREYVEHTPGGGDVGNRRGDHRERQP